MALLTGLLYEFSNDYLYLSFEPRLSHYKIVKNDLPEKYGVFSVLNDTPKHQYLKETYQLNNTGIQIKLKNLIFLMGTGIFGGVPVYTIVYLYQIIQKDFIITLCI